jgi:hypothetical protein
MDIFVTYAGESREYNSTRLMYIEGKQNARPGTVGTIVSPKQAKGVIIDSAIPDVNEFSFSWRGKLRQLLVKTQSKGGQPSSCTVRLLKPRTDRGWKSLSGDVTLVSGALDTAGNPIPILFNPHALAEWGDMIYLIDYESHKIVILGADELEGMSGNYVPLQLPFTFTSPDQVPLNGKGQSLVILGDKLSALYIATNATAATHEPGVLCRLDIGSNGALTYDTGVFVGLNPQAIVPVNDGDAVQLLIPAIGGYQHYDGTTNGVESNVCCVPALGSWPSAAAVLLTGDDPDSGGGSGESKDTDPAPTTPATYDIHALAAGTRGASNKLYILTQVYINGSTSITQDGLWRIYETTVGAFLSLPASTPITTAVTAGKLKKTDEGVVESLDYSGVYFWDLLYAQTDDISDAGDLLWAGLGSPILVTRAAEGGYGSPTSGEERAYVMFGFNGGNNVNSIDLTIETINQAKRGGLSLKRSLYGSALTPSGEEESK